MKADVSTSRSRVLVVIPSLTPTIRDCKVKQECSTPAIAVEHKAKRFGKH